MVEWQCAKFCHNKDINYYHDLISGYARQQSEDYKLKLLEGIVKPRTVNKFSHTYQDHSEASTSTRSVLDALREISRKRIHTNEVSKLIYFLLF